MTSLSSKTLQSSQRALLLRRLALAAAESFSRVQTLSGSFEVIRGYGGGFGGPVGVLLAAEYAAMTSFDELRSFLSEHVQGQSKERALRLLDAVRQEERRKGEESLGGAGPFGRPNGESAAHAAFVGDALPGGNGVLGGWPSVPSVGAGAWGKPSLDGMGAGVAGGAWGGPGGFSAAGAWSFGASGAPIDSDEAAVLAGLALDGAPPGLGGSGITWNSNPVASFDLVDPAADTSRFAGAFMMPKAGEASAGDASGGENTSGGGQGGPSGGMSAGSAVGGSGVGPGAPKGNSGIPAPQQTPGQPQPAVKFSSVVGGQAAPPRSVPAPGGDSSAGGNIPGVPMPQSAPGQPQTAVKFSSVVGGQAAPPRPAPAPMTDGDKRDSKRQV